MRYVTFDAAGVITGCYLQDLLIAHEDAYLEIDEDTARNWTALRVNLVATMVDVEVQIPGEHEGEVVTIIQSEPRMVPQLADVAPSAYDLAAAIAASVAQTYLDVDAVYDDAIGRRGTEYAEAETDARAYVAAGYTGTPTAYVSGYAASNSTGAIQTYQWAADGIIARADAFRAAQISMRNTRFDRQADMRAATTETELVAAVAAWDGYIAALRVQLGIA